MSDSPTCLIVGTGPAGLIAADILSANGLNVSVFERRPSPGWKLLVAGSSRLNISHGGEEQDLPGFYFHRRDEISKCLGRYTRENWLSHIHGLGEETFLGTSRRYFLNSPKAAGFLQAWIKRLQNQGVTFHFGEEIKDFQAQPGSIQAEFSSGRRITAKSLILALGGASWEDAPVKWPEIFREKNISFTPFSPSNAGFHLKAPPAFFTEAEGKPLKGVTLHTAKGSKTGELMITRYGLEGTPVYTVGCPGQARLDLKPDLSQEKLLERLKNAPSKRRLVAARLSPGAELLFKHLHPANTEDPRELALLLKSFPVELLDSRPLSESISAKGGVSWDELDENLQLKKFPGIFCAGEMVDWDAPTGGFLIQACVSMGAVAAYGILAAQSSGGAEAD